MDSNANNKQKCLKNLKIVAWNANGLLNRRVELIQFLKEENVDICLISETHFTPESYIFVENYVFYHALHPDNGAHAGAGILIKRNIKHYVYERLSTDMFQAVAVGVTSPLGNLVIASMYSPPKHSPKETDYANFIDKFGKKCLIAGDWNSKHTHWGSKKINTKGRALLKATESLHAEFASQGKPTHYPSNKESEPDVIDFGVFKGIPRNKIFTSIIEDQLSSDHIPVLFNVTFSYEISKTPSAYITKLPNGTNSKLI